MNKEVALIDFKRYPKPNEIVWGGRLWYANTDQKHIFAACSHCGEFRWVELLNGKPRHDTCKSCARRNDWQRRRNNG